MIDLEWRCFCCSCLTQWAICTSPDSCSEGTRHGRIRWSSKWSMIDGGSWGFPILFANIWNTFFVLLAHIHCWLRSTFCSMIVSGNFELWCLIPIFFGSHPRNSWLQTVTQKVPAVTFRLFHSAGGNPAVVRCEQTTWESSECWNWSISTRDNERWTNEITR